MSKEYIEQLSDVTNESTYPKKYRKKPVVIIAVELKKRVKIKTREGILFGEVGDFIIEGIQGEIYPCGREIFFKTYDEVK